MMIERVRAAYEVGLASMSVGDHHNMAVPYVQNTPILGRLLAVWSGRPAGALFLFPLWNPVLAAEQIGTLAATHDGPFIVQAGIGHGDDQFRAFGTERSERGRRLDEAIRVVQALLAGDVVDSAQFGVVGGRVGLRPPEPVEWWIGAGADVALDRAARVGDVWYAGPGLTLEQARERLDVFRDRCAAHGRTPRAVIRRDVLVLRDGAAAARHGAELVRAGYRGLGLEQVIAGGPSEAAEIVEQLGELGFEEVVMRCMSPDQQIALETIEQMGQVNRDLD